VALNGRVQCRATIMQRKTGRPVQFEITEQTREAVGRWLEKKDLHKGEPLFPSRLDQQRPMTTRQYARLLASWLRAIGLDPLAYGTHSLRRTKASMTEQPISLNGRCRIETPVWLKARFIVLCSIDGRYYVRLEYSACAEGTSSSGHVLPFSVAV
jgi:hypothetical protein